MIDKPLSSPAVHYVEVLQGHMLGQLFFLSYMLPLLSRPEQTFPWISLYPCDSQVYDHRLLFLNDQYFIPQAVQMQHVSN